LFFPVFSMFDSRTVLFVAFAALVSVVLAAPVVIKGDFKERRVNWDYGFLKGKFYYLYNAENPLASRLRFDYSLNHEPNNAVSSLYNYEDAALYSMNSSKCTGLLVEEKPDPWWIVGDLFVKTSEEGGMAWYARKSINASSQVKRILMKKDATAPSNGYLNVIQFNDGRTITFSNVVVDNELNAGSTVFQGRDDCPTPSCPVYADIVFVLDTSGSVDYIEWNQTVEFVGKVMDLFTFGKNDRCRVHICIILNSYSVVSRVCDYYVRLWHILHHTPLGGLLHTLPDFALD